MRKKTNHLPLELIDIVKQELLAVLAVTGVLAFVFNYASADQIEAIENPTAFPITTAEIPVVSIANTIGTESNGATLFDSSPTMDFGPDIQGINNENESWSNTNSIANIGDSLLAAASVQVTISNVSNGTFTIYANASGNFILNGTKFAMGNKQSINREVVTIKDNRLKVEFEPEAKIWTLSTLAGNVEVANDRTPTILSIIPEMKSMRINTILSPVAIVQDQDGTIMPTPSIKWSSSDTTIATVDDSGKIKALKAGVVTISATIAGTDITASLSVNVPNLNVEAPPTLRINSTSPENMVDQLVAEIAKGNTGEETPAPTNESVIGITQSLFEYFSSQKTSAVNLDTTLDTNVSQTNPATTAKTPILQIIGDFFNRVFSFMRH